MKNIAFRVDSGLNIGNGHVMRCLTLATTLNDQGLKCHFVTRPHNGHISETISKSGFPVYTLEFGENTNYGSHPNPPAHSAWLGGDWRHDAISTNEVLRELNANWLIVDHYALDAEWETLAIPMGTRIAAIDDLADRAHNVDLLIDQNMGRISNDYFGLTPSQCKILTGPEFALIRPEFSDLRERALARRKSASFGNILVTLGGVDTNNATGKVIMAIFKSRLPKNIKIDIVMGKNAPHLESVLENSRQLTQNVENHIDINNMHELMLKADICIGAAGTTALECCTLALPTLQLILADNQIPAAKAFAKAEASIELPSPNSPNFVATFSSSIRRLREKAFYNSIVNNCSNVTDGLGRLRVARSIYEQ